MKKTICVLLLASSLLVAQSNKTITHSDYVPNAKTAERIAEAVLIGQFGDERVREQSPLSAELKDRTWLVQGHLKDVTQTGGNFGVWINKHDGCVKVIERMK